MIHLHRCIHLHLHLHLHKHRCTHVHIHRYLIYIWGNEIESKHIESSPRQGDRLTADSDSLSLSLCIYLVFDNCVMYLCIYPVNKSATLSLSLSLCIYPVSILYSISWSLYYNHDCCHVPVVLLFQHPAFQHITAHIISVCLKHAVIGSAQAKLRNVGCGHDCWPPHEVGIRLCNICVSLLLVSYYLYIYIYIYDICVYNIYIYTYMYIHIYIYIWLCCHSTGAPEGLPHHVIVGIFCQRWNTYRQYYIDNAKLVVLYICVYIYRHIHTYKYIYTYIYIYSHLHTWVIIVNYVLLL